MSFDEERQAGMIGRSCVQFCIFTLLLAPSMAYSCLYLLVFNLNVLTVCTGIEDKEARSTLIVIAITLSISTYTLYHIY